MKRVQLIVVCGLGLGCLLAPGIRGAEVPRDYYASDGGTPADIYRAWDLFRQVSGSASVAGELRLADLSRWNHDSYRSAFYWCRRAASLGNGIAAADLWYMYATGHGAVQDREQAASFRDTAMLSPEGEQQVFVLQMKIAIDRERHYTGSGTALVEFEHAGDGKATEVKLYSSSGDGALDEAAIQAVQDVDLPPVPDNLQGQHHFVMSVSFGPED